MQEQFNPAFEQTYNTKFERVEGLYQISPFGVVLQPVVPPVRPSIPITLPSNPPIINAPASRQTVAAPPPTPSIQQAIQQQQQQQHPPLTILSPLSVGGFLYTPPPYPTLQLPPNAQFPTPAFLNAPLLTPNTKSAYVSTDIAARQEKLEKYREKRAKRNFNRPVDQGKRERACARSRDQYGQFTSETKREQEMMRQALEASHHESELLKSKLSSIEQELQQLRKRAEEEKLAQQNMMKQLEAQHRMNQALLRENTLLWSTVPADEVFSTINPTNPPVFLDAFKQKIDFSTIELNWTDSPHLEAARTEDMDFEQRWDEMGDFLSGAQS